MYLLAGLTATPLKKKARISEIKRKDWFLILAMSITGAVIAPLLFFTGLAQSKASDTSVLSNAEIIFTVLLAIVFFREKLKPIGYLSIALVIVGVIIITNNLEFSASILNMKSEGDFLILAAMVFWGLDNNISKIASQRIDDAARLIQLRSTIGGSCLFAIVLLFGIPINITLAEIPKIVLLGVAGFGISYFFFLNSLKRIGTVRTMVIYSTSAIFGLFLASIFLHESIGMYQVVAITMMLAGIFLIERKDKYIDVKQINH